MASRQVAPLAGIVVIAGLLTACTSNPIAVPTPDRTGATSSPSPPKVEITPESPEEDIKVPGIDAGETSLLTAGPTKGSRIIGEIQNNKKTIWVMFDCRGAGTAEIALEPLLTMPITCLDNTITPTLNKLDLISKGKFTIRVQAPDSVEWALRVTR
jgi:hypothetical protein